MNSRTKKFLSYYKPYRKLFFADMGCAVIVSLTALALPLCIRVIIKNLELPWIYLMGGVMLLLIALHTLCNRYVDYQGHAMGARIEGDMRNELFNHLQKLSFNFYDENKTGQLMTRLTSDTFDLAELFHHGPEDIVIATLNFLGALIILTLINPKLSLAALLFIPIMALYGFFTSRKMRIALKKSRDRIGDINAQIEESLAGIRVVQSFTNEGVEKRKFAHENSRFVESRLEGYKAEATFYDGLIMLTHLMTLTVVIFGAVGIVKGSIDLADLLTFLLYIALLIEPIQRLGNFGRLYEEGIAGFNRFMDILEIKPEIHDKESTELKDVKGEVAFKNVSFKYREDYDHVLKNISLKVAPGEFVALVGASGVGKTTLCSLIPRFYEVTDGEILIDGKNICAVTLRSLREAIGVVQQEVYLFSGTVFDNIRYGKSHATKEEIVLAAKMAHAHEFIETLPQGYQTDIGQRGVKLSGGQKQRLSLARVFLKDPPILIFDEATSALDNESERAIQESLEKLALNRTMIVIAHRLSTIRHAKRIIVLTEKGIEEEGTHEELIALKGAYANLYQIQHRLN